MSARLPEHLRESAPRRVSDLNVGEQGFVTWTAMTVDGNGECFLDGGAELRKKCSATIGIKRTEGGYHVIVVAKGTQWRLSELTQRHSIPVATITEEYDPDLDGLGKLHRATQGNES